MKRFPVLCLLSLVLPLVSAASVGTIISGETPSSEPIDPPVVPTGEGEQWKSSYTIGTNETTGVIWCEYDNKDRWWKLDGGDASIAAPVFVDANPNEPKMSGSHTTRAKFYFKSGSVTGKTMWKVYTYTDGGEQAGGRYPGYSTTGGSGEWSNRSGITITITVTDGVTPPGPDDPDDPPVVEPAKFCVTPYLQHPASDAMTIIFFTDSACTATAEAWPANAARPEVAPYRETTIGEWAEALTNNVNASDSSAWNNRLYRHRVRFEGLKANRSYDYTVTLAGGATYSDAFRTAPGRNTPIRFVSYADCETTKTPHSNYVKNLTQMKGRDPDFITISGDLVAKGGLQQNWDGFWQANAGAKGTIAGSIPVLTVIGNHDLFDNGLAGHGSGLYYDMQGEPSTERFLSYFEVESNGVDFAHAPAPHTETRDLSQLFHRVDYGPVTLIFLDTNNGDDSDHDKDTNYLDRNDGQHLQGGLDRNKGCRHPDFNVGSPQYVWLTNNLAEAQAKSRFTFVFNHHCPYSRGAHNRSWSTGEDGSALALRFLTETFVRYGVDGWYCGHDELLEHSVTTGDEVLPDGTTRPHTLSIYDLGGSGDPQARNSGSLTNPLEYNFLGNYSNGYYGFLETDVTMDEQGRWTCTVTPYSSGSQAHMSDRMIYVEDPERAEGVNDLAYAQHGGISGVSTVDPSTWGWVEWTRPEEGVWDDTVPITLGSVSAAAATYAGRVLTPNLTVRTSDGLLIPPDHYEVTDWSGEPKDAGTYTAKVTGLVNVSGSATVSFTINPKPVTVTAKDASKKCDEEDPELEATVDGVIGGDTVSYTLTRKPGEGVGTYPITASGEACQGNYSVTFAGATFKIKANGIFVDGEDSEIEVSGMRAVDVGAQAVTVGKLTVTGTGDLTISNCQNLAATSFDLSGLNGTVTYLYVSDSVNKSLPSGLADAIKGQTDQKVKYAFRGTTEANGWSFGSWSGTAGKALIQTHLVMEEGTHAWTVEVSSDNTSTYFGANGTDANPTLLIRGDATLNFTVHDLSGYKGTMNAGGVIRVNADGKLNILTLTSGSHHNFNYRQRLVLDPGSETIFDYSSSYLFVIHGGSDIGGDVTRAQIYVPESDGAADPAILRRKSSNGAGLCINGNSQTRGGGCAIYVGAGSKLLLDANVKAGESDSGSGDRVLAKYGAGELEITGGVTSDVKFDVRAGIITLPASSGAFNGGLTATADVTYRFPEGWEADAAYTLGSGKVTGTAPAAETATVYVGNEKLTDRTLVYSGNTVSYAGPHEPTPFELLCAAAAAGETYVIEDDLEFPADGVLTVPAGTSFVLDLKGHAITCHADGAIVNHGTLTILDSTKANPLQAHLSYSDAELGKGYALIRSDGELTVDGVFADAGFVNGADSEFGGGNTAIAATGGRVTVKNGAHVGGQTAINAAGGVAVEVTDSHVAGRRVYVDATSSSRGVAVSLSSGSSTLSVSNSTLEAEGFIVSASRGGDAASTVTIIDSVLATSRTTAPFDLGSGVCVSLVRSIYVDRMAKWFPVTTSLANAGADLKVGAGCLLAVASANAIGFLDEGVTAAEVATRVWRTKGADDEALPPLTPEEETKIAEVLSSSPDALLKANVTTVRAYSDYKEWVDAGVASGAIESEAAAKGAAGSFFSFATAQPGIVDTEAITEEKVEVKKMEVKEGGSVKLTVGIADLPVGEGAKQEYLEQVFGVTGTGSLQESFVAEKVVYKQDMSRNDDGTVSYTVEPKTDEGAARPDQFYFKARVSK